MVKKKPAHVKTSKQSIVFDEFAILTFVVFFEECIKEEQYEAQKLDIMRDAIRAKATYNIETKKQTSDQGGSSADSSLPTSPREMSPPPTETNGTTTLENGSGHSAIANGNGTSGDVPNGNSAHVVSAEQTTAA